MRANTCRHPERRAEGTREELQQTYYRFVAMADRKKNIYDQDLVGLLPDKIRETRTEPVSELD